MIFAGLDSCYYGAILPRPIVSFFFFSSSLSNTLPNLDVKFSANCSFALSFYLVVDMKDWLALMLSGTYNGTATPRLESTEWIASP